MKEKRIRMKKRLLWMLAADSPIKGYSNLMYTFHFYAATHKEMYREKVKAAVKKGLPVFVSEFVISESSGKQIFLQQDAGIRL